MCVCVCTWVILEHEIEKSKINALKKGMAMMLPSTLTEQLVIEITTDDNMSLEPLYVYAVIIL